MFLPLDGKFGDMWVVLRDFSLRFGFMYRNIAIRRLFTAAFLLLIILAVGVIGFGIFEDLGFIDSIYMTFITMSTVGYEVLNGGLTDEGKIFVIFLIIFTIGTFFYVITTLTTFIVEGELRNIFKGYRVNQGISKIKDHIIICGLGRTGSQAVLELESEGVPCLVIEKDEKTIEHFLETHPKVLVVLGDGVEEDTWKTARLEHARGVVVAMADDADNVFATLTIKELNPDLQVVARASHESAISKLRRAGANRVILPNMLGGRKMAKVITQPDLMDFVDMITGQGQFQLKLEQINCFEQNALVGHTLKDLNIRSHTGVLVLGMQDDSGHFELNPSADRVIRSQDKLFILGTREQLNTFTKSFVAR